MRWDALFERADAFDVTEAAVQEALATRRETGRESTEPNGGSASTEDQP